MKALFKIAALSVATSLISGACREKAAAEIPSEVQARIRAVERSLKPALFAKGRTPAGMNIQDRMKRYHVPGVSVAVINQGTVEWAKGYGVTEAGGRTPVTPETLFQAASISKPVTALGVLRLVERGTLALDSPVNDKLVSWKIPENEFSRKEKVTLRRLLTHGAGLTVSGFPGYAASERIPTPIQVLDGEKPANTPPVRIDAVPGSQWRYSGGGFVVAQVLVSDAAGRPFPEYMKTTVLDPLGMGRSTFEQPLPRERWNQAASGHLADGRVVEGRWHIYPELAAAGLWTTPSDLCRFAVEIQKSAAGESPRVISRETAVKMLTPGIGDWGLGIGLGGATAEDKKSFSHGGGNKGFSCMLFAFVHKGQGAVVMTNSDAGNDLVMEILRSLSSAYGWSILQPRETALIEIAPAKLAAYVGDFRAADEPEVPVLVSLDGGQLHLISPETGDWPLSPVSETEFVYLEGGSSVTFHKGPDGRIDKIQRWGADLTRKKG